MKNKIVILLIIIIILSGVTLSYKEEIKEFSDNIVQNYILEKIHNLPKEQQEDFDNFRELKIEDKLLKSWEINQGENS